MRYVLHKEHLTLTLLLHLSFLTGLKVSECMGQYNYKFCIVCIIVSLTCVMSAVLRIC